MAPGYDIQRRPRRGRHVVAALRVHLDFATNCRRGVPGDEMPARCENAMRKACGDFGASLREPSGETGHGHPLAHCPPKVPVTALVNTLKGMPARRLRPEHSGRVNRARMNGHFRPALLRRIPRRHPLSIIRHYIEQHQRPA